MEILENTSWPLCKLEYGISPHSFLCVFLWHVHDSNLIWIQLWMFFWIAKPDPETFPIQAVILHQYSNWSPDLCDQVDQAYESSCATYLLVLVLKCQRVHCYVSIKLGYAWFWWARWWARLAGLLLLPFSRVLGWILSDCSSALFFP